MIIMLFSSILTYNLADHVALNSAEFPYRKTAISIEVRRLLILKLITV